MKQRNSLCHVIPSVSELLDTKISDKHLNVDDGLSAQNDESLFLIASMVFLQKHLKRKLGQEEEDKDEKKRTFSDMLLFETRRGGDKERFYIRLKNIEKFDGIKQSETCVPKGALSTQQILPTPKKPKLCFSRIFRAKSKKNFQAEKKTRFNLFKKNKSVLSTETDHKDEISVLSEKDCSSNFSLTSDWTKNIKARASQPDRDLLKVLPSLNSFSLKNSPSQNFRSRSSLSSFDKVYHFDNVETFSSVYSLDSDIESIPVKRKNVRGKVRQQQSKLSVCLEDESESENEFTRISSKMSYNNFPDEVKANLSPEVLQSIVSQMILYLEERPEAD